jgi:hypothetical protein
MEAQGPQWVDCGSSVSGRQSAAVGGFLPFAGTRSGDKGAPKVVINHARIPWQRLNFLPDPQ